MIRGTNAQFKFKLPYNKDELEWVTIKFWQSGNTNKYLPILKNKSNCVVSEDLKEWCVSLTAEETARFSDKYKAKMQIRALHGISGTIFGSHTKLITVYPMSDDIIDENPSMPVPTAEDYVILDGEPIFD